MGGFGSGLPMGLLLGVAAGCALGCGGGQQQPTKTGFTLGHDDIERAVFLSAAAMLLSHEFCTDAEARACYELDDARCARVLGDAVLRAAPFDLKMMAGPEQLEWLTGPGTQAMARALDTVGPGTPCRAPVPIADFQVQVVPSEARGGVPCVRAAGDATPCKE